MGETRFWERRAKMQIFWEVEEIWFSFLHGKQSRVREKDRERNAKHPHSLQQPPSPIPGSLNSTIMIYN